VLLFLQVAPAFIGCRAAAAAISLGIQKAGSQRGVRGEGAIPVHAHLRGGAPAARRARGPSTSSLLAAAIPA
jgi:hypothetical protein